MSGETCTIPPAGWYCTRERDHEGPCAAYPEPDTAQRATHIKCDTYTDWQPAFSLSKEQREAISKWMKEHDQAKHIAPGEKHRYSGAIGGAYTWEFTPTSLGVVVTVRCACEESIDVSDYDEW